MTASLRIVDILAMDRCGPDAWRTRHGDPNMNGRSYGGQLLGQAMRAALMDVPDGRDPTAMQFLFLQGAMPDEAIDLRVQVLQEGRRFSSRRVSGSQASGRTVLEAQVTCAEALDAVEHDTPSSAPPGEVPEDLPDLEGVRKVHLETIRDALGGYSDDRKDGIDFRIPDAERQLAADTAGSKLRFWMRAQEPLPDDPRLHAAVFAYMSDWWLNFSTLGAHIRALSARRIYVASLNHAIWLHRPFRADGWMHVETSSPAAAHGRGLSIGRIHDRSGRLVASATQESLMAYAD